MWLTLSVRYLAGAVDLPINNKVLTNEMSLQETFHQAQARQESAFLTVSLDIARGLAALMDKARSGSDKGQK